MPFDNMATRACRLQAELTGYASSAIDISAIDGFLSKEKTLPPLVLSVRGSDPRVINEGDADVPAAARPAWGGGPQGAPCGRWPGGHKWAQEGGGGRAEVRARLGPRSGSPMKYRRNPLTRAMRTSMLRNSIRR